MKYREIYTRTCDSTEIILMKDIKYRTIMDTLEARNNVWSNELISYKIKYLTVCSRLMKNTERLLLGRKLD